MAQEVKVIDDRRRECYRRETRASESCRHKSVPAPPDVSEVGNRGIASGVLPQAVHKPAHVFAARPLNEAYSHVEKAKLAYEDGSPLRRTQVGYLRAYMVGKHGGTHLARLARSRKVRDSVHSYHIG